MLSWRDEHPVRCRDVPAFHFHPTQPRVLGSPLIGNQVVEMRQPGGAQKCCHVTVVSMGKTHVMLCIHERECYGEESD